MRHLLPTETRPATEPSDAAGSFRGKLEQFAPRSIGNHRHCFADNYGHAPLSKPRQRARRHRSETAQAGAHDDYKRGAAPITSGPASVGPSRAAYAETNTTTCFCRSRSRSAGGAPEVAARGPPRDSPRRETIDQCAFLTSESAGPGGRPAVHDLVAPPAPTPRLRRHGPLALIVQHPIVKPETAPQIVPVARHQMGHFCVFVSPCLSFCSMPIGVNHASTLATRRRRTQPLILAHFVQETTRSCELARRRSGRRRLTRQEPRLSGLSRDWVLTYSTYDRLRRPPGLRFVCGLGPHRNRHRAVYHAAASPAMRETRTLCRDLFVLRASGAQSGEAGATALRRLQWAPAARSADDRRKDLADSERLQDRGEVADGAALSRSCTGRSGSAPDRAGARRPNHRPQGRHRRLTADPARHSDAL